MKIYVDLLILLNSYLDFLILLTTSVTLKRKISIKRLLFGTLLGNFSLIFLFIPVSTSFLFLIKILLAFFMNIITFHYQNLKYTLNNLGYFYMISIILGGILYYFNLEFSNTSLGMFLKMHHLNINLLFLLLISPLILYIYYRQAKKLKTTYDLIYDLEIGLKNKQVLKLKGYLDTGNQLKDPITNKPILLVEKGLIQEENEKIYYIPFHSLNNHNLLKCCKPSYVKIKNKIYKNYLLGLSDKKFNMEGIECILNNQLREDLE